MADSALWMCLNSQGLCYLCVHISCHSLTELKSSQDCRGELHRGESQGVAQEERMGPFTLLGLEDCSSQLQGRCWPGLELPR